MSEQDQQKKPPATMAEIDDRDSSSWMISFGAAMVPFCGFLYGHQRGMTARTVEAVVRSPVGVYGLLALPFVTLAMEKSIYDTVQSAQGFDPKVRPADRGGFPSGGADLLPSFSLIPVQKRKPAAVVPLDNSLLRRVTAQVVEETSPKLPVSSGQ